MTESALEIDIVGVGPVGDEVQVPQSCELNNCVQSPQVVRQGGSDQQQRQRHLQKYGNWGPSTGA